MSETLSPDTEDAPKPAARRKRTAVSRGLWIAAAIAGLLVGALVILLALNTAPGRDFVVSRLAKYQAESGLNVRVDRIEGSIYGRMRLHGVQVRDARGAFLTAPLIVLDWRPVALLQRKVDLRELRVPNARMLRKPELKETPRDPDKPLLPDIDIAARNVSIGRLVLEPGVTGRRHVATLTGSADLHDGRAQIDLRAAALQGPGLAGGDKLQVVLDAVPEQNRLRLDMRLSAPTGGLLNSYANLTRPLQIDIAGRGDWADWAGRASAKLGGAPLADFSLRAQDGRFRVLGQSQPGLVLSGAIGRLVSPSVAVDFSGVMVKRRLDGRLSLRSEAAVFTAKGRVDLAQNRFTNLHVNGQLAKPGVIADNLTARGLQASLVLNGPFSRPLVAYQLSADALGMGGTIVEGLQASGRSRTDGERILIPVNASAARIAGLNAAAGGLLTNVSIEGKLALSGDRLISENLRLRSDRIDATAIVIADLSAGVYTGSLKGRVNDYVIDGFGRFDLVTNADLASSAEGGFGIKGAIRLSSRRVDNAALRDLLGGNGTVTANIALDAEGVISLANLRLTSPSFEITSGRGSYVPGGALNFVANGRSDQYGPLAVTVGGSADQPRIRLTATAPDVGVQLRNVELDLIGAGGGYKGQLSGLSPYGKFTSTFSLRTEPRLAVDIAAFQLSGITLSGSLTQTAAGPMAGALQVTGSGLGGEILLSAAGDVQRLQADIAAQNARLALDPIVTIETGRLTAVALLPKAGPQVDADIRTSNLRRGELRLASARATLRYKDGRGEAGVVAQGESDVPFDLAARAEIAPRQVRANVRGSVNRVPLRLGAPAVVNRIDGGWRLEPTRVVLPEGQLVVRGQTGPMARLSAQLRRVDLGLVQAFYPAIALQGEVSGSIDAELRDGRMPTGTARLTIDDFSRVALATASPPVDIVLRASLTGAGGDVRALVNRGGRTIGRLQAQLVSPSGQGDWNQRLMSASLAGGIRYNGPSEVLWAMAGMAGHTITGPIAVAADFSGRVGQPMLNGVIRADALRYANPRYGSVISNIAVRGAFTRSRLDIASLTGRAGDGTVSGSGWVGLDADSGFPMELRVALRDAQLASSDDLGARATGDLEIRNGPGGALIQGTLQIPEARYQIVRQGSADVPELEGVRRRQQGAPVATVVEEETEGGLPTDWRLDLRVLADNRIFVTGMGLESEWSSDLRVRGTVSRPVVTGQLEIVRGAYSFAGRRLELTQAEIRFDGVQATNPLLQLAASTTVEGVTATVNVTGRAQNPQISFSSTPYLPQDEVLSRLLFGSSIAQLSPTQAIQIAASLNSLRGGGGGLNPLGKLRAATGVDRLRILGADDTIGRGAALAAGRYLTGNVYVEIITDARGFTATQLEISLSKTLSLLLQTSSFGGSDVQLQYSRDY